MSDTVVVFGATSYVGSHVVRGLLARGLRVIGVSRGEVSTSILLGDLDPEVFVSVRLEEVAQEVAGRPVAAVNFAFVKDFEQPQGLSRQNQSLMEAVAAAAGRGGRVIQISTAAVFGYVFDREPSAVRVRRPPPELYAETKLQAEHLAERLCRRQKADVAILRLGNVVGPGSPLFLAALAQQILEGRPLGYEGEDGPSNVTHIDNIADYIAELVTAPSGRLEAFGRYHHLAEFSAHPWSEFLDAISAEVGLPWLRTQRPSSGEGSGLSIKQALKRAYLTDTGGRLARAALGALPESAERWAAGLRVPLPPGLLTPAGAEAPHGPIDVLSNPYRFRSHTLEGWTPALEFGSALTGLRHWLAESGYAFDPTA